MSDIVIQAENLGKSYIIGHEKREHYVALRDVLATKTKRIISKTGQIFHGGQLIAGNELEEFWALKDINFEIKQGDRLGIIGRNGAGKSTLLKVLSRITDPTKGKVQIKGRVASLLEVGTGFHPELTGRENIYLNGAILGMSRIEIKKKFDEIVDFSGVEKFLDTPVKRYSSGMYVRLAFSVAANLESEILIVDEVLAVGDAAFQKKCLGKMGEVATNGRTVLFVSHNMNAIEQLCTQCILIEKGTIKQKGSNVSQIINNYLFPNDEEIQASKWVNDGKSFENPWFKPKKLFITDANGKSLDNPVSNNQDIWIQIEGTIDKLDPALEIGYSILNEDGIKIYWSYFNDQEVSKWPVFSRGEIILRTKIPKRFLNESIYTIELLVSLRSRMWIAEPGKNQASLNLMIRGGLSDSPYWTDKRQGVIAPLFEWEGKMKVHEIMPTNSISH